MVWKHCFDSGVGTDRHAEQWPFKLHTGEYLGPCLDLLGDMLGRLGAILWPSWVLDGPILNHVGQFWAMSNYLETLSSHVRTLLGRHGISRSRIEAFLEPSWFHGPSWCYLETLLRPC